MKRFGFGLFVLLSASLALPAESTPATESDENLDKQVKALDQQIKALEDQINQLRKKQAPLLAEQQARAAKRWEIEARTHFAKAQIRGYLRKSPVGDPRISGSAPSRWQVVVHGRSWEVRFPEKDKEALAAARKRINQEVVITGTVSYEVKQEPQLSLDMSYPPYNPAYRQYRPPEYLFVVAVESLQPAPKTASNAADRKLQKSMEAVQERITRLSRKGDDITRREEHELLELQETLKKLHKALEARLQRATVEFCGRLRSEGPDSWQIQIGFGWNLHFANKNELKALAKEQEGKRVILTGTITADPVVFPSVNVESLKPADCSAK